MSSRCSLVALGIGAWFLSPGAWAQSGGDVEGSHDHAMVKRYPGARISGNFVERDKEAANFPLAADKFEFAEGRFFSAMYVYPQRATCALIVSYYEKALKAAHLTLYKGVQMPDAVVFDVNNSAPERWLTAVGSRPKGGKTYIFIGCANNSLGTPTGPIAVMETEATPPKVEAPPQPQTQTPMQTQAPPPYQTSVFSSTTPGETALISCPLDVSLTFTPGRAPEIRAPDAYAAHWATSALAPKADYVAFRGNAVLPPRTLACQYSVNWYGEFSLTQSFPPGKTCVKKDQVSFVCTPQ